jgi:hypothetical protein
MFVLGNAFLMSYNDLKTLAQMFLQRDVAYKLLFYVSQCT